MEWRTRGTLVFFDVRTWFHSTGNGRAKELWVPSDASVMILRPNIIRESGSRAGTNVASLGSVAWPAINSLVPLLDQPAAAVASEN